MGNGTKIGLVLVLVLVVVVIANLLDNEVDKGRDGIDQAPNVPERNETPRGRAESATPTGARSTDRRETTPSYEAGRDRRLAGGETRTNGAGTPGGRTGAAPGGTAPPSVIGDRSVATDPSGLRDSPTGAGRPSPLDASAPPSRPAAGTESAERSAIAQDPRATGAAPTSAEGAGRVEIIGRDPAENSTSDLARGLTAPLSGSTPGTPPATSPASGAGVTPATARGTESSPPPAAAREEASRAVAGFPREHVVAEGENLWKIAEKYYQKPTLFTLIAESNPGLGSGDELKVGQKIKIPAPPASAAPKTNLASSATPGSTSGTAAPGTPSATKPAGAAPASGTPKPGFRSYTIQDGDTLYDIAEDRLGSGNRWPEIQAANPGLDPGKLRVGATIQLPGA